MQAPVAGAPAAAAVCLGCGPAAVHANLIADFEDVPLGPGGFYNGSDGAGGFESGGLRFGNDYNPTFASCRGFAASRVNDPATPGFGNQYAVISGTGVGGGGAYGVSFVSGFDAPDIGRVRFPSPAPVAGLYVNNTTYAALSMQNGDAFAKQFGGADGGDPDFFLLTIRGLDSAGAVMGSVDVYLADYRFEDPAQD